MTEPSIIETLRSKEDGAKLAKRLEDIRSRAIHLLKKIGETFPEYTLHDISHSDNVITNFDLLIPDVLKEKLNIYEIYFLVASAYLHDIGMVNFPELIEEETIIEKENFVGYIRDNHHSRSEKFIAENYKDLMIDDPHQATIIGRICRGHRKENLSDTNLFNPSLIYTRYPINIALLSSLLRIADEFDLTFERAPLILYEHVPPRNEISNYEWQKHLSITGVAKHPEDPLTIKCSANCENSNIHRALKSLELKINSELDNLVDHLHQYRSCRKEIPRKFLMDIKAVNYKYHDFRFSLQEKEIISLLMGEKLYANKAESLRELLKNSVDACRFRKDELRKQGLNYEPKIVFHSMPAEHKIQVEDNGIGMDEYIIESYFTKIGHSFYRSEQFINNSHNFEPVGELGIGVLSYFMIADKITIETSNGVDSSLIIEIDDISDYFFVKQGNRKSPGTVVTLDLSKDFKYQSLTDLVKTFATHIEFPIEVFDSDGVKYVIEDRTNFSFNLSEKYYKVLELPVKNEYFSGSFGVLVYNSVNIPFAFYQNEKLGQNYISSEGILVSNDNTTNSLKPSWITPNSIYYDINIKKDIIDLNVARNSIVDNEKLVKFKNVLEEELINALIKLMDKCKATTQKIDIDYSNIVYDFFKNYIQDESNINRSDKKSKSDISKNFIDFARSLCYFKCFTDKGMFYLNYKDITKRKNSIILLSDLNYQDDEYLSSIIESAHTGEIIIADEKGTSIIYLSKMLFNISPKDFIEIFSDSLIEDTKLDFIFSDLCDKTGIGYFLFRPQSYFTTRFIEYANDEEIVFNEDNEFIRLIINNKDLISDQTSIYSLEDFFLSLSTNNKYMSIRSKQKNILKFFAEKGIIANSDVYKYIIKQSDFPPSFFEIEFQIYP